MKGGGCHFISFARNEMKWWVPNDPLENSYLEFWYAELLYPSLFIWGARSSDPIHRDRALLVMHGVISTAYKWDLLMWYVVTFLHHPSRMACTTRMVLYADGQRLRRWHMRGVKVCDSHLQSLTTRLLYAPDEISNKPFDLLECRRLDATSPWLSTCDAWSLSIWHQKSKFCFMRYDTSCSFSIVSFGNRTIVQIVQWYRPQCQHWTCTLKQYTKVAWMVSNPSIPHHRISKLVLEAMSNLAHNDPSWM